MGLFRERVRQATSGRFRRLVLGWLATIPDGEDWEGSVNELHTELSILADDYRAFVPRGSALTKALNAVAGDMLAAGWEFAPRRTATARLLTFVRVKP